MSPLLLSLLLLLLVALVALFARPQLSAFYRRFRPAPKDAPVAHTGQTLIMRNGEELTLDGETPALGRRLNLPASIGGRRLLLILLVGVIAVVAIRSLPPTLFAPADQFIVLVAPFREMNGGPISQTGRTVANELARTIPQAGGGRVVVQEIDQPPADVNAALALMDRYGADALVWGEIIPGGMLDQESLLPLLAYRPTGAFAPLGWEGYSGRFAMPVYYSLAGSPFNGRAVLPDLLGALANYGDGKVDAALTTLDQLTDQYPALTPILPGTLRGNIFWARGEYGRAAGEYKRAILAAPTNGVSYQTAMLYNNMGAILQDANSPDAAAAFDQAAALLGKQELGALRYNLGLAALHAGRPADAARAIEQARRFSPPTTALLLDLSEAYRANRQFDQAQAAIEAATEQQRAAELNVPPDLRELVSGKQHAATLRQRALLDLARTLDARGPLLWELQSGRLQPEQALDAIRKNLDQAAGEVEALAQSWMRRAAAEDAAGRPVAGLLATGQARRTMELLREHRRWLAAVEIEISRARGAQPPTGVMGLWASLTGDRSAMGQARRRLTDLLTTWPGDVDTAVLLGHGLLLGGDKVSAGQQFDTAAQAAPQRPEPIYGQALVALSADRRRARDLLLQAIGMDDRYFPARQTLAALAQQDGDWPTVIDQRRWLARNRPSVEHTLALAEALRFSGPAGYAEAERSLLPLANQNDMRALIELSRLYRAGNDPAAAAAALTRAQSIAPRDPSVAFEYGDLLESQDRPDDARRQYQLAVDANPNHIQAHLALARLAGQDAQLAATHYRAALQAGATDLAALKRIGAMLVASGEYGQALTAYERAIKAAPDDAEAHHGLAQAQLQLGRLDQAQASEQRALDLRQGDYDEALVGMGDIALRRGNYQGAVEQYNAALARNEHLTAAYIGLGRAAAASGNWSVAQAHFRNAVAREAKSAEGHLWLAEALIRLNNASEAIRAYEQALALNPRYAEAYFGLAQAQMTAGAIDRAQENLRHALALRPNYAEALLLQGKLFEQQGLDDQAIETYGRSITASAQIAEPRYRRALLFIRRDRMSDAEDDLKDAVAIQSNFPEAHYWLGRTYLAQGRAAAARNEFQQAITQRGGNYAEARFYQGIAEEQLGLRDEAAASYRAALEQDRASLWAGEAEAALARLGRP